MGKDGNEVTRLRRFGWSMVQEPTEADLKRFEEEGRKSYERGAERSWCPYVGPAKLAWLKGWDNAPRGRPK